MKYQGASHIQKQNIYRHQISPLRPIYRQEQSLRNLEENRKHKQASFIDKEHSKNYDFENMSFRKTPKHTTSQMVYEDDLQIRGNQEMSNLGLVSHERQNLKNTNYRQKQDKKFNGKNMQIESKINKIQSYHQKIQNLLEIVSIKSRTPIKNSQKMVESLLPSRSLTKLNTPISNTQNHRKNLAKIFDKPSQEEYKKYDLSNFAQSHFNNRTKHSDMKQPYTPRRQTVEREQLDSQFELSYRKNKHMRGLSKDVQESARKKSKQYMKSIQGQVQDIQNTIELLNKKIKQTDNIEFRKQMNFDDLSTSNPQSIIQSKDRRSNLNSNERNHLRNNKTFERSLNIKEFNVQKNPYEASSEQPSQERSRMRHEQFNMRRANRQKQTGMSKTPQRVSFTRKYDEQNDKVSPLKKTGAIYKYDK